MRQDTVALLAEISQIESISAFTLVGGTAISLHANHRVSEDLDFAMLETTINRIAIDTVLNRLRQSHMVTLALKPFDIDNATNEGVDLLDHHQDWLVDAVKITFFAMGENARERDALKVFHTTKMGYVNVMELDGLFVSKCLVLTERIKSRDIFDLWWMVKHNDKPIESIFGVIQELKPHIPYETIRARLLSYTIPASDEGLESLIDITIEQVRAELTEEVNAMEIREASAMLNKSSE